MEDTLWSSLTDNYVKLPMALTAEKLAEQYGITRNQCDEFALSSQQRWSNGNVKTNSPFCVRSLHMTMYSYANRDVLKVVL